MAEQNQPQGAQPGQDGAEQQPTQSREEAQAQLDAQFEELLAGKKTLAEIAGVTAEQVYAVASLAHRLLREGQHEQALTMFEGLIALNPRDPNLWVWKGSTLHRMGPDRVEDAIKAYTRALELDPKHVTALANRGELNVVAGRYEEGLKDLKAAVENDPKGEDPTTVRARAILATVLQKFKERQAQKS
ncbi:MAG: hypothetical protein KatS3mg102_1537 [Planctomycetota bacterium]|nr:MAG: hypothetical protein KatS3mg102_1537 [Planctomycetota bacterium]